MRGCPLLRSPLGTALTEPGPTVSAGVLGLMGSDFKHGLGPMLPGQHLAPYPDCYRCPFKLEPTTCGLHCVDYLRFYGAALSG